jgi:homeobox-leucine zipper protein
MNFDDTSNTNFHVDLDLDLGLALRDRYFDGHRKRESKKKEENPSKYNKAYPSLTLGPSNEENEENTNIILDSASKIESCDQNLLTSPSIESSFSNSTSMKKEKGEELEIEIENVPITKIGNVDEDGNPRKKLRLTKEQSEVLEENFKEHSTLNPVP